MKATWEEIVDYARGIASDEAKSRVEADADALARVAMLRQVSDLAQGEAPESWVNRAKALLPKTVTSRVWKGQLAWASSGQGFRSGPALARDLRFQFEGAQVELRMEPIANSSKWSVVGLFTSDSPREIRVTEGRNGTRCDEMGQFELHVSSSQVTLRFEDVNQGDIFEVEIE